MPCETRIIPKGAHGRRKMDRILVTGASGGIGKAICEALEVEGIKVCKTSTTTEDGILADLRYDVIHLCHGVLAEIGVPDIIINSAGILPRGRLLDMTDEIIQDAMHVNLIAPIRIIRFFLPQMMERKSGYIINIGSSSAYEEASRNRTIYSATKGGIVQFTKSLYDEVKDYGIRVTSISPASVDTTMHVDTPTFDRESLIRPEEMAKAVMYILSMTGPGIVGELRIKRFKL